MALNDSYISHNKFVVVNNFLIQYLWIERKNVKFKYLSKFYLNKFYLYLNKVLIYFHNNVIVLVEL